MGASTEFEPTSTGLDANLAGVLCYLLGFISGVAFLVLERQNGFVRFHAMQSTITSIIFFVANVIGGVIPPVGMLIMPLAIFVWILLMVKAFQGERYKLPWVGDLAEARSGLPPA